MRCLWPLLLLVACFAFANDADVSFGGSPKLLSGKASVRMLHEKIVMDVNLNTTKVTCDFWFKNEGPTATLRVGFPDDGNANEGYEEGGKLLSNFQYFKSWVNDKSVPTGYILGNDSIGWHVKTVRFPKGATVHVRDEYLAKTGAGIVLAGDKQGDCRWARYVVHTGASWKGNIGETLITVNFAKSLFPNGVKPLAHQDVSLKDDPRHLIGPNFPKNGEVVCKGVSTAEVSGNTLTFTRKNWRPRQEDDLDLWFSFRSMS